ncbi:MAG: hypothetical protein KDJ38_09680 [Gammaproteobacteria bacterium]|nr:hypothetical protein [Gammaproteobacteria bacterium]
MLHEKQTTELSMGRQLFESAAGETFTLMVGSVNQAVQTIDSGAKQGYCRQ